MATTNPSSLQTFFLLARRFVFGAPKLRLVGAGGPCFVVDPTGSTYQLDVIPMPSVLPPQPQRKRYTGIDSSILPSAHPPPLPLTNLKSRIMMVDDCSEPTYEYQLEKIDPNQPPPVPYWYDSPHFRPNA